MGYFIFKALASGVIIALVSEVARRWPGLGALIASLPLISVISVMVMIWLWRDRPDVNPMADHAQATFWFVLPSLPMFLLIPARLHRGWGFWPALLAGCILTVVLYSSIIWSVGKFGIRL